MVRRGRQHCEAALDSESPAGPAESETLCMRGHSMFENREISIASGAILTRAVGEGLWPQARRERYGEVRHRRSTEEGAEQRTLAAEALEGRPVTEGNSVKPDWDQHTEAEVSIDRT